MKGGRDDTIHQHYDEFCVMFILCYDNYMRILSLW